AWRAALVMREYLRVTPDPDADALLLAARAEAGWGGWSRVRSYLEGKEGLNEAGEGQGWYWLARAFEEDEAWREAWDAYDRYLDTASAEGDPSLRAVAKLRQGLVLLRLERPEEAAELLAGMRSELPDISARIDILAAEALATTGDTAGVRRRIGAVPEDGSLAERGRKALLRAYEEVEDYAGAYVLARSYREAARSASQRADYALVAGRMAHELGNDEDARAELRVAASSAPSSAAAAGAARLLEEIGGLSVSDRLTLARVYDARGDNARAAGHYQAWLEAGA